VLTSLPGVETWPCDEINYIWRHGNARFPSDEFPPSMATQRVCRYIRGQFDWVARKYQAQTVVEKTCANSLRVGFVNRVIPKARYIFIRRDGLDAIGSAVNRWKARLDVSYLARKARFVPAMDLPYYAGNYLWSQTHRIFSRQKRLAFWGPKLRNMERLLQRLALEEVCALQWKRCVEAALVSLEQMNRECWLNVRYEDFVADPVTYLNCIAEFLCEQPSSFVLQQAVQNVSTESIGKGRYALSRSKIEKVRSIIDDIEVKS
jgi:hypothetical protein